MHQPHPHPEKAKDYSSFVPFTARMMAAIRAQESTKAGALFIDPFARQLAGEEALQQVEQQLTDKYRAYVAVRTYFFDNFLLSNQVAQVVILAAGLDTRSFRLRWPKDSKVYELDYPEVISFKAGILADAVPNCEHITIGADLTQPWQDKLLEREFAPKQPSMWLIEGLLMYLSAEQVHSLLRDVSELSANGSCLGLDLVNVKAINKAINGEPHREYFQSGWDQPEELLAEYGWDADVIQPGDKAANFGRYTWVLPPREIAGMERTFLVSAKR